MKFKIMLSFCAPSFIVLLCIISYANAEIYFQEQFKDGDNWKKRWVQSKHRDDYGKFNLSHGKFYNDPKEDLGLTTVEDMRYYAVSAKFPKFSNKGKTLVIQYAVKRFFTPDIDCGGLYIKLMKSDIDQEDFNSNTPYRIMFGPDRCGATTSKIHAIFRYKDFYESNNALLPLVEDPLSHVYTLVLYANNSYEILVDNERRIGGDLEDSYDFLLPRKIPDPNVTKPSDWVDEQFIDDPEDKKPDDWDRPMYIRDEDAKKPEDWDDDMDGEWELPWVQNPEYKGEWKPKKIKNPAYKGAWEHPKIDNPEYKPDPNLYLHDDLGVIGIEIWQVEGGTTYDNIIITDSIEEAQLFAALTLNITRKGEEKMKKEWDEEVKRIMEKEKEEREKKEEKMKKEQKEGHGNGKVTDSTEEQEKEKSKKEKEGKFIVSQKEEESKKDGGSFKKSGDEETERDEL